MSKKILNYGISIFLIFLGFTYLVSLKLLNGLDLTTTKALQAIIPRIFDLPFSLLSLFGSAEIILLIILILWFIYRKLNIFYVFLGFVIFHVIELFSKAFVEHFPPPHNLVRYFFDFSLPSSAIAPGFSYPSGHVGRTMFLAVLVIYIIYKSKKFSNVNKKILYFAITFITALMFVSRVYLAEHWLTDVLGGAMLGLSLALISLNLPNFRLKK